MTLGSFLKNKKRKHIFKLIKIGHEYWYFSWKQLPLGGKQSTHRIIQKRKL